MKWEEIYKSGLQLNKWPYDGVVTYYYRNRPVIDDELNEISVLEVGSGAGNNLWFLAGEGCKVTGLEMSESAITSATMRFDEMGLDGEFIHGTFEHLFDMSGCFDMIIDRASLTCVSIDKAKRYIEQIVRLLKSGGTFYFTPYSTEHTAFMTSDVTENGLVKSPMYGFGPIEQVAFYNYKDVTDIFKNHPVEIESINLVSSESWDEKEAKKVAFWEIIVRKR